MIQSFVGRPYASGRKVEPPLCIYIDEAQNVLYHGIEDLFAKAGGANVWLSGFCQSVAQIYAGLGKDYGNAILDNTNTKIFLRVPDTDTANYVSHHFGEQRQYAPVLTIGGQASAREMIDDFVKVSDVLNLSPREFFQMGYSGNFRGITTDVSPLYIDIQLPQISTTN